VTENPDAEEARERLVLEALVAYSDACTLPLLTPNCPFYLIDEQGHPTCGTECGRCPSQRRHRPLDP
jgi:hypothetical protein